MSNEKKIEFAGYTLDVTDGQTKVERERVNLERPGDHGCDPLGDGTYRMVPSGDVVDGEEMRRRLNKT